MTVRIALTLGDPGGIGAEVVPAAAREFRRARTDVDLILLGPDGGGAPAGIEYRGVGPWDGSRTSAGSVAAAALERAASLALEGGAHAIVTGPVHKPSLRAAGRSAPGQTELLQELTAAPEVGMLMAAEETRLGGSLRVLLATTHLPLREVPVRLTLDLLLAQGLLLHRGLRRGWGIDAPRLAVCGLNPHASDEGLFGDEEAEVMVPAIDALRSRGVDALGPLPADTVFGRALAGEFDAVVAPYHDVGMAPFKTVSFGHGVNVTLGLPFPRTSPDHGTAFDIVGSGTADPTSTLEALRLAVRLAEGRFDTPGGPI